MINCQPSTNTKSMSLNGNDTMDGETIIIPIDIRTLATTISIIKNGMKIAKLIWNAVFNSLVMKAGINTR